MYMHKWETSQLIEPSIHMLTNASVEQAKNQSEDHEDRVPLMLPKVHQRCDTQEDKDDGLTDAAKHLQEVLYGRVGFLRDVGFHIGLHEDCAEDNPTV